MAKRAALERCLALRLPLGLAGNLLVVEFFRKMSGVNGSPLIWGIKGSKNGKWVILRDFPYTRSFLSLVI